MLGATWRDALPLAAVDFAARVAVPASLLSLLWGRSDLAVWAVAATSGLAVLRGFLAGRAAEAALNRIWDALVATTRSHAVALLHARAEVHGVAPLLDAAGQAAHFASNLLPQALACGLGLVAVALVVLLRLGAAWLLLGVGAVLLASPVLLVLQRRLRRDQRVTLEEYSRTANAFSVLNQAAIELRAHGTEARQASLVLDCVRIMAAAERRVRTRSALSGLLPMAIALLAVTVPFKAQVEGIVSQWAPGRLAETALLGSTALVYALALMRALEGWVSTGVYRRELAAFLDTPAERLPSGTAVVSLRTCAIELEAVRVRYPDSRADTPSSVQLHWPADRGLALVGPNGSGKTTLARCLIGLQVPTSGKLTYDGVPAEQVAWPEMRARIAYVPQHPFIAPDRSVGWHLRLTSPLDASAAEIESALHCVGLASPLRSHGGRCAASDVLASELSGGERKRLALARACLGEPDMVVLDEPEAGLDPAGRLWLRGFLADVASRTRVLLIAHDWTVLPEAFLRLDCVRTDELAPSAHSGETNS